jgi:polar amino acid transport system substrate-binding protein
MQLRVAAVAAGLWLAAQAGAVRAQSPEAIVKAELAPTGTLRAAINYNNPLLARRDAATGELSGVAVDLSRELARRLAIPVQLIPFDAAGKVSDAAKTGVWDLGFLAIDPARAADIDYTAPHLLLEGTYLVPAGSPLKKIEDVDRPGVRIAVTSKSAYDLFLSRELKNAKLVYADTTPISIKMMVSEKLDAVAAVRTALATGAKELPGSLVLPGNFMTIPQAVAVPKGRPAAIRYVRAFVEEMKSSGFIAAALQRQGLGPNDAIVAPPSLEVVHTATYIELRPEALTSGARQLEEYLRATRNETGNARAELLREDGRRERFVLIESWQDKASFAAHEQAKHTESLRQSLAKSGRAPYDQRVNHDFANDARRATLNAQAVYLVTHVDVPGARREEAEVLLKQLVQASRNDTGQLRYDVFQQNDPRTNHFTVVAVWRDQRAFDASATTPHWQKFRDTIGPMLGALYDERIYKAVALAGRAR